MLIGTLIYLNNCTHTHVTCMSLHEHRLGDGPCLCPPNISRTTIIGFQAKYEMTKKVIRNFGWGNRIFCQKKVNSKKYGMTKKRSSDIFGCQNIGIHTLASFG